MKKHKQRRSYADSEDRPDPFKDFQEYVEAILDGASGPAKRPVR